MSMPLTADERRRLTVDLEDFLPVRRDVTAKHRAPYSKREEGRNRRMERHQAIARKRSFLD